MLGNGMSNVSTYIKGRIIRLDTDLNVFVVLSKITRINNILANKGTQFCEEGLFSERPLQTSLSYQLSCEDSVRQILSLL